MSTKRIQEQLIGSYYSKFEEAFARLFGVSSSFAIVKTFFDDQTYITRLMTQG
jgi:ribosomal protein S17E